MWELLYIAKNEEKRYQKAKEGKMWKKKGKKSQDKLLCPLILGINMLIPFLASHTAVS